VDYHNQGGKARFFFWGKMTAFEAQVMKTKFARGLEENNAWTDSS